MPHVSRVTAQSGQIVLLLVLITVIGLTVGLSLIARTVTDVRISSQIEQSGRAFSAAEAGVESALRSSIAGAAPSGSINLTGAVAQYSVKPVGGTSDIYTFPVTDVNKVQVLWLAPHNTDGTLDLSGTGAFPATSSFDLCWGSREGISPAVALTLIYVDGGEYKISKAAFDSTNRGNGFTLASDSSGGYCNGNYTYRQTINPTTDFSINPTDTLVMLRISPVYDGTAFAIVPSSPLPVQANQIVSVGQTETGIVRRIEVTQGYQVLPEVFDFTFFTEN